MNRKADRELNGGEDLLVARAHGIAPDECGRMLRHKHRVAAIQMEDRLDVIAVQRGFITLQNRLNCVV